MPSLDRRHFLTGSLAGAGALALGGEPAGAARRVRTLGTPRAGEVAFTQGIASGQADMGGRGITLWTRAAGLERDSRLELEVARDPNFRNVILSRDVVARKTDNYTVHARILGEPLQPGEQYFYRFSSRFDDSEVGRFRTSLPPDSREPVRIGFFSCQAYDAGYYTAHAGLAAEEDLDYVICLGDYIYEKSFYEDGPRNDRTGENRDGEVETLGQYRSKYALYHSDANLRRLRAKHPLMAIWDDHEAEDNYAALRPGEAADDRDLVFRQRRANAYRTFFEHMPRIRDRPDPDRIYGRLRLGRNAELFLLDERRFRSDQPCGDQLGVANCPGAFDQDRTMLGDVQRRWFKRALDRSAATWKIIGNQDMFMALDAPAGNPINPDQWDGYKAERQELMNLVRNNRIENVAFVTGDIHTFFAGDVGIDGRGPDSVATEFVGGSVTSLGIREGLEGQSGAPISPQAFEALATGVRAANPHIKYDNLDDRGFGLLEATQDELKVQYKSVDATRRSSTESRVIGSFRVARGEPRVEEL